MAKLDIDTTSLEAIAGALRNGSTSAMALADWAIDNHERRDEAFHAYKTWDVDKLRTQATAADAVFAAGIDLGPLQGIPVSVKDLIGVSGYPIFAGCPRPLPEKWQTEGPVVGAIRHQLGVISGKSHTVQFAFGGMGFNQHWGAPRNPWDAGDHRAPGGSSSGAGVSLGEGSALLAIGSDTAGSVRIPASMTGNAGMRPTAGRWSTAGIVPLSSPLDTAGPLTRTAADLALAFAAIDPLIDEDAFVFTARQRSASLADFHIGICDWLFDDCEPGIAEGVKAALDELVKQGLRTSPATLPHLDAVTEMFAKGGLHIGEFASFMNGEMADYRADLDPTVAIRIKEAANFPASEHIARLKAMDRMAPVANAAFAGFHAVVGPTLPMAPPKMSDIESPEAHLAANFFCVRNTNAVSLLKLCAVTIPVALDAVGMPVGLQIICPGGGEETALAIAMAFERALGTARDRLGVPPMCAVM
ncbi:MAG: aspartyl-tRNA(Asn)/glutamyl-tRNA(Gln) amidotransferase subunit A [Alphaproteobacteria bacterium]|jgi:aspartyl-tRNA(Asn)/glutamyl-tRNA(Gln) amidotransferase subunit A